MSEDASAGRLHVDVVADTTGLAAQLRSKLRADLADVRARVKVELNTAGLAKQRAAVNAALKDVRARVAVDVSVSVTQARAELKTKLAQAARGVTARVRLEVDERQAVRAIRAATKDVTTTVRLEADTAAARAQVEALRRSQSSNPIDIPVRVNRSALSAAGQALVNLSKAPAIASGVLVLAGAVTNLAGGLVAVTASASQAVGVLAALPNLAGIAVQGIGALVLGLSGVGTAVKAMEKAQQGAAATAVNTAARQGAAAEAVRAATERVARAQEAAAERVAEARKNLARTSERADEQVARARETLARAQEAAAERIASAEQRLADVRQGAARRLADAEADVTAAHAARQRALDGLNAATATAIERQQDLALALAGSALDEEGAKLAVERAANRLRDITGPGSSASDLDRREADLAYRQAVHALEEVHERHGDLAKEKAESDRKGVQGSDEVVAAQQRVAEATDDIATAEQQLAQVRMHNAREVSEASKDLLAAQRDGAREVMEAQRDLATTQRDGMRDVADAQADLVKAQRDGARDVVDAQRAVAQAMAAQTIGATRATAANTALAAALAKLSPQGRKFARFVAGTLKPRFRELKFAVADALLPPLQRAITLGMPLLDTLQAGMVDTADRVGSLAVKLGRLFGSETFNADVAAIMKSNNRALSDFGDAGIAVVEILARLAKVAGPILVEPFAKWVKVTAEAARTSDKLSESRMAAFLTRAAATARTLFAIMRDVAVAIYNVGRAARPTGDTLLSDLATWAKELREATEDPATFQKIREFFEQTLPVMRQFGSLLERVAGLFVRFAQATGGGALDGLFWVFDKVLDVLEAIASLPGGGVLLTTLLTLSGAGLALGLVAKALGGIATNIARLAKFTGVTKLLSALGATRVGAAVAQAATALPGRAAGAIKSGVSRAAGAVKAGVSNAAGALGRGAAAAPGLAAGAVSKITGAAKAAATAVATLSTNLLKAGAKAVVAGIASASRAIGAVAGAAWRGVTALGALALGYARVALAAGLAALKQLAMATAAGVVRAATLLWTGVQWLLNVALNANPISLIVLAIAGLVAGIVWAYKNVGWFREIVDKSWAAIKVAFTVAWERVIKPIFSALVGFIVTTLIPKLIWLRERWSTIWTAIRTGLGVAWSWIKTHVFAPMVTFFATIAARAAELRAKITTAWNAIRTALSVVWTAIKANVFAPLVTFITKTIPDSFKKGVEGVKTFWDKLSAIAKKPVAFVVNTIYNDGIRKVWNWISEKVGGNLGQLPLITGFARGGILPGTSSYRNGDDQLVAMRRGEGVYVSEAMRDPYERARLYAINRAAMSGRNLARFRAENGFAEGGILGNTPGYSIGGIIGEFIAKGKKFFADGLKNALNGVMNPIISLTDHTIGQAGGIGKLIAQVPRRVRDGLTEKIMSFAGQLEGGDGKGVIAAARKYLGQGDRGRDNDNIFNDIWGWPAGTPWCANFVSTAVRDAKAGKAYPGYPTAAVYGYYSNMRKVPLGEGRPGDVGVYYGPTGHVNLLASTRKAGGYDTIGGNQGPKVNAYTRGSQYAILRPEFAAALGGIVPKMVTRVFGERNADPADRKNPLIQLMNGLPPNLATKVGGFLTRIPALNRDSGGPIYPGGQFVYNGTGALEWTLTPEAVDMLGGPAAVQSLNVAARLHRTARPVTAPRITRPERASGVTQNIYPQPRQSEYEIGMVAARKLGQMLR